MTDVILLRIGVKPGWPERAFDALVSLGRVTNRPGPLRSVLDCLVVPVLREEGMHTESVFLDRTGERYELLWYMEAEDMDDVYEGYEASGNPLTDASEWVLNRLLEVPEGGLTAVDPEPEFDLLVHAVNPDRPGRVS